MRGGAERLALAGALIGICVVAVACNSLSGIDELEFDLDDDRGGGHGGTAMPAGGGGDGGAGGTPLDCGPCDAPPGPCFEMLGACVDGSCLYPPLADGTVCSDEDPCTEGDVCDAQGTCVPGLECPNDDPCIDVACDPNAGCMATTKPDGASCGPLAADRCCGGSCVDVSSDPNHCGGCGYVCVGACESVAATNQCSLAPADTSGRCACAANSQCPVGQICRTQEPHSGRCTPEGSGDCPGTTFVDLSFCPNYCAY